MGCMLAFYSDIHAAMASLATRRPDMVEDSKGGPACLRMAGIATGRRRYVISQGLIRHPGVAVDVAVGAGTSRNAGMSIRRYHRDPCPAGTMASAASLGRRNMQRRLTGRRRTVMTTHTSLASQLRRGVRKTCW